MLDHTTRLAAELGVRNVVAARGDTRALPYPDDAFDAAYLTVVFGEVPDQAQVLRELRYVLKPGGRLVVGEIFPDFHTVPFGTLRRRAETACLSFERRLDGPFGYFARFRPRQDGPGNP